MKKFKLKARANIINPRTGRIYSDKELLAFDGYFEDIIELDDNCDLDSFFSKYEEEHPEIKGMEIQIEEIS